MSVAPAPPVPRNGSTLRWARPPGDVLTIDLATRALVVAVVAPPRFGREAEVLAGVRAVAAAGADVAEVPAEPRLLGPAAADGLVPVTARAETGSAVQALASAGASVVLVPAGRFAEVAAAADAASVPREQLVAVVDSARAARDAIEAAPQRLFALDATRVAGAAAVAEESMALALGVRLVRTGDIRRTRRVVEVMAHLLEARR